MLSSCCGNSVPDQGQIRKKSFFLIKTNAPSCLHQSSSLFCYQCTGSFADEYWQVEQGLLWGVLDLIRDRTRERKRHTHIEWHDKWDCLNIRIGLNVFRWICTCVWVSECIGSLLLPLLRDLCLGLSKRVLTYFAAFANWQDKVWKCNIVREKEYATDTVVNVEHTQVWRRGQLWSQGLFKHI